MSDRSNAAWEALHADVSRMCYGMNRCPDRAGIALCLAWQSWQRAPHVDLPAEYWARLGSRRARSGRDLIAPARTNREPFVGLTQWHGSVADEKQDYTPGPVDVVMWADVLDRIFDELHPSELPVFQAALGGMRPEQISRDLGIPLAEVYWHWQSMRDVVEYHVS